MKDDSLISADEGMLGQKSLRDSSSGSLWFGKCRSYRYPQCTSNMRILITVEDPETVDSTPIPEAED